MDGKEGRLLTEGFSVAAFIVYKHGIQILDVTPTGSAGLMLNQNFIVIGDLFDTVLPTTGGTMTGALDMGGQEIVHLRAENAATAPSSPAAGQMYFSTTDSHLYVWNGLAWRQCDN